MDELLTPPKTSPRPKSSKGVDGKGVQLDKLNLRLLDLIDGCRLISSEQIFRIFHPKIPKNVLQVRLLRLHKNGYLARPPGNYLLEPRRGRPACIYAIGPAGAQLLGVPEKSNHIGDFFLKHTLAVSNFFAVLFAGSMTHNVNFSSWEREPETERVRIPEAGGKHLVLRPDAKFEIEHQGRRHLFFLEHETGTVARWRKNFEQSSWWRKACYYRELRKLYEEKGLPYFRVLAITRDLTHLNHLRAICRQAEPRRRGNFFWFALQESVTLDDPSALLFGRVWFVPHDLEGRSLL